MRKIPRKVTVRTRPVKKCEIMFGSVPYFLEKGGPA